jgi:plastocyanin
MKAGFLRCMLAATLAAAACFSDRSEVTPPIDADLCNSSRPDVVTIRNFAFQPAQLRVARGTRVTWVNCDNIAHTSTADAGAWDSPLLTRNLTFSHTFEAAGQFGYHCDPHPHMTGTISVD